MENFNEFSIIEQAAMEQSPAYETEVGHHFVEAESFIGKIIHAVEHVATDVAHVATDVAQATKVAIEITGKVVEEATPETPEIEEVTAVTVAAAGGIVVDGVFTKQHLELLKSMDQECSVDELIDLRKSLMKANRMLK